MIDDSLVRGTTCSKIIKMLFKAGAKEVHVRIACPEIKYPDFMVWICQPKKNYYQAINKKMKFVIF